MAHRLRIDRIAATVVLRLVLTLGPLAFCPAAKGQDAAPGNPPPAAQTAPEPGGPYMRIARPDDRTVRLEVALRRFAPAGDGGPDIWLAAVIHLGQADYYDEIQRHLDAQDLVLYEGVGRPAFLDREPGPPPVMRRRTDDALRFVAIHLEQYRRRHGGYPATLGLLRQEAASRSRLAGSWLGSAMLDAWGRPLHYEPAEGSFSLSSRGADGRPGGRDAAADLRFADQPPLSEAELAEQDSIQASLASALGLVFQLHAVEYDRPHFRHSDLGIEDLRRVLGGGPPRRRPPDDDEAADGDATRAPAAVPHGRAAPGPPQDGEAQQQLEQIVALLDGSSWMASVLRFATRLIGASPRLRATTRLMLIEMLGQLEGDPSRLRGLPPEMSRLLRALIRDRNRIVIRDLQRAVRSDDPPRTISVFYGAGHMPDLEARLMRELDYRPVEERWLAAFSADADETGLSPADLRMIRSMIRVQMRRLNPAPAP